MPSARARSMIFWAGGPESYGVRGAVDELHVIRLHCRSLMVVPVLGHRGPLRGAIAPTYRPARWPTIVSEVTAAPAG